MIAMDDAASTPGDLRAPFPWFGGKSLAAPLIWEAFGNVPNFVEPFAGSCAVLLARPHKPKVETVNDKDGFICVAPETRVLMQDLTWCRAGDLKPGASLLAFDEENPGAARSGLRAPTKYRRWRKSTVVAAPRVRLPCYRLTFDDGTVVVASENHCWLSGSHRAGAGGRGWRWIKTKNMIANRSSQRSWVLKAAPVVEREQSWDAGWLAGIFDGEGHLITGPGLRIGVSQNEGVVLDHALSLLAERGFRVSVSRAKRCAQVQIRGGLQEQLRFLMMAQPKRLLAKFAECVDDVSLYGREHSAVGLVSKEYIGEQEVVALSTSTRTFIAEGLASHNCNFWRAVQHDAEEVAKWADWPVNEADLHARHRWLADAGEPLLERLIADPMYFDARIAGWWCWGICTWIGNGWCSRDERLHRCMPKTSTPGHGITLSRKKPLTHRNKGVHRDAARDGLYDIFAQLQARLRNVRVCCGDWTRVLGNSTLGIDTRHGMTPCGIVLDPPYAHDERDKRLYREDDAELSSAVRSWAIERGDHPDLRIALCGWDGEHAMPKGWTEVAWRSRGSGKNRDRERIWFSPHCESSKAQRNLFG